MLSRGLASGSTFSPTDNAPDVTVREDTSGRFVSLGTVHSDEFDEKQLDSLWGATGLYIYLFWSHDFPVGNANGNANGNTNGNTNGYCRALQAVTSQMPRNSTG